MITGFRVARGGAQERFGVLPDLTIMGKIIGGGLPAAAYGGPRELMERIAPAGDVYQAGTLSGNPLAVAAGLATLEQLDDAAYERLAETTEALADGHARRGRAARGRRPGPEPARPADGVLLRATRCPTTPGRRRATPRPSARWCRALLARGVYPPPSQFEAWFPSLVHGREHVTRTVHGGRRGVRGAAHEYRRRCARRSLDHGGTLAATLAAEPPGRRRADRAGRRGAGAPQLAARRPARGRAASASTSCCWR